MPSYASQWEPTRLLAPQALAFADPSANADELHAFTYQKHRAASSVLKTKSTAFEPAYIKRFKQLLQAWEEERHAVFDWNRASDLHHQVLTAGEKVEIDLLIKEWAALPRALPHFGQAGKTWSRRLFKYVLRSRRTRIDYAVTPATEDAIKAEVDAILDQSYWKPVLGKNIVHSHRFQETYSRMREAKVSLNAALEKVRELYVDIRKANHDPASFNALDIACQAAMATLAAKTDEAHRLCHAHEMAAGFVSQKHDGRRNDDIVNHLNLQYAMIFGGHQQLRRLWQGPLQSQLFLMEEVLSYEMANALNDAKKAGLQNELRHVQIGQRDKLSSDSRTVKLMLDKKAFRMAAYSTRLAGYWAIGIQNVKSVGQSLDAVTEKSEETLKASVYTELSAICQHAVKLLKTIDSAKTATDHDRWRWKKYKMVERMETRA